MIYSYEDFTWAGCRELEQLATTDEPWAFYLNTEVHLASATRSGIVRPVDSEGSHRPPFGTLHVISATQPGEKPESSDSQRRLSILDQELRAAGLRWLRAVGSSIHGGYSEEGRAILGLDDDCARSLGYRFGQVAIFSWRGPHWSLLACAVDRQAHRSWQWTESPWRDALTPHS
jgi:hypothetical protein